MTSPMPPLGNPADPTESAGGPAGPALPLESQLRRFVGAWETVVRRPEELLVDDHLGLVLPVLARALDRWLARPGKGKPVTFDCTSTTTGLKGILVRRIRERVSVSDPAWDVLRATHGSDVDQLIAACNAMPVDARLVLTILKRGLGTPHFRVGDIIDALLAELATRPTPMPIPIYSRVGATPAALRPTAVPNLRLLALTTLLAREYALDDDSKGLAGMPEQALNGTGIEQALSPHVDALAADGVRLEAVWATIRRMAARCGERPCEATHARGARWDHIRRGLRACERG